MKEQWKDVVGYEGYYRVSSFGRVRTVDRVVVRKNGALYTARRKFLKPWPVGNCGHLMVGLYKERGKRNDYGVHRLVLEAFVGPCPKGMECRHLDGNPDNNRLSNLCWGTHQENCDDREIHGTHPKGSKSAKAKLTEEDIPVIRRLLAKGKMSMNKIGKVFEVDVATIRDIRDGRTWRHVK